jgi:hypothetical protein
MTSTGWLEQSGPLAALVGTVALAAVAWVAFLLWRTRTPDDDESPDLLGAWTRGPVADVAARGVGRDVSALRATESRHRHEWRVRDDGHTYRCTTCDSVHYGYPLVDATVGTDQARDEVRTRLVRQQEGRRELLRQRRGF